MMKLDSDSLPEVGPAFGQGGLERAVNCILTGMGWIGCTLIVEHSNPPFLEALLTWPMQTLGGALIIAGIIETIMD